MFKKLIIVGAGIYSAVVYDIALELGIYGKIFFVDDNTDKTPFGCSVMGRICDIPLVCADGCDVIVAIGNSDVRERLIEKFKSEKKYRPVSLVSPKAFVSPLATVGVGCVIEPMAVVHPCCTIEDGCIVSAGAVLNHGAECGRYSHIDCNSTVEGYAFVPAKFKLNSGNVFSKS